MFRPRVLTISKGFARCLVPQSRIIISRRLQSTAELPKTPQPPPPPPPPRKSIWRTLFRYTFRLIYISAIGGVGFFAYRSSLSLSPDLIL
jgi:hypothetical protein